MKKFWNLNDNMPTARGFMKLINPSVKTHHKLYIERYFEPITLEGIQKEMEGIKSESQEPTNVSLYNSSTKDLLTKAENKLRLRLICDTIFNLPIDPNSKSNLAKLFSFQNICCSERVGKNEDDMKDYNYFDTIILHFHGGGFVSQSSGSHQIYSREYFSK